MFLVVKRDGKTAAFHLDKIAEAIKKHLKQWILHIRRISLSFCQSESPLISREK